jgi:hypothetical protein
MSIINQLFRQKTGTDCPTDIIDKLQFQYLFPELWIIPWNLQQDICLLRKDDRGFYYIGTSEIFQPPHIHKWSPIQIINHLRSVECPNLYYDTSLFNLREREDIDFLEVRELITEDVIKRGGKKESFLKTKLHDQKLLSQKLDQIIEFIELDKRSRLNSTRDMLSIHLFPSQTSVNSAHRNKRKYSMIQLNAW